MNTNNNGTTTAKVSTESKKKVTITATDRIGRTESITLVLSAKTAERLQKASQEHDDLGEKNDYPLFCALNAIYDRFVEAQGYPSEISRSQFYKLRDFFHLVYHKFYNYTLSIAITEKGRI